MMLNTTHVYAAFNNYINSIMLELFMVILIVVLLIASPVDLSSSLSRDVAASSNQDGWHDWHKLSRDSVPQFCFSNSSSHPPSKKLPLSILFKSNDYSYALLASAFEQYNDDFLKKRLLQYRLWSSISTDDSKNILKQNLPGNSILGYGVAIELIWKNQHPRDCSNAQYLIAQPHDGGFGSEIHTHAATIALGVNLNRVVLLHPNVSGRLRWQINNSFCSHQKAYNVDCYYEPWSSCSLNDALGPNWTMASLDRLHSFQLKHQHKLLQVRQSFQQYDKLYEENREIHRPHKALMLRSLIGDHRLFPYKLLAPLRCYNIKEMYYHYWWRSIVTTYLIRPNQRTLVWLDSFKSHVDITQDDICVAIYIRRADKVNSEMVMVPTKNYADAAVQLLKLPIRSIALTQESGEINATYRSILEIAINQGRRIVFFVGTEDDAVIAEVETMLFQATNKTRNDHFNNYHVRYTNIFNRSTQVAKLGLLEEKNSPKQLFHHEFEYLSMLLNLQYSARSHGWVCTLRSNWCKIVDEIRATLGGMASNYFIDLSRETCPSVEEGQFCKGKFMIDKASRKREYIIMSSINQIRNESDQIPTNEFNYQSGAGSNTLRLVDSTCTTNLCHSVTNDPSAIPKFQDLRKIDEIFSDEKDSRTSMLLSKRKAEFQGNLNSLCRESKIPQLLNLSILNLYDNELTSVHGIGLLSNSPLEDLNLGSNKLSSLPLEFGSLATLKSLWLEDNEFDHFPIVVCQLTLLTSLRLSGNSLQTVPFSISALVNLETLAVDNNEITQFPDGILRIESLKHLWLRQNKLDELPSNLSQLRNLETLSVSSNFLADLPACLEFMTSLKRIYANGNRITSVNTSLSVLSNLEAFNLSNNKIDFVPIDWVEAWGKFDTRSGILQLGSADQQGPTITLLGNPISA